jgi:hypothetical protein
MKRPRLSLVLVLCGAVLWSAACRRSTLPPELSDKDYWALIESLSEPAGTFSLSDNLVSNEPGVAENVRKLSRTGGVFIGVGPEQNFSYVARLRPVMAFIVDIRRENRNLHLLYKALFTLSSDRADFVSRLFSRPRPAGLGSSSSAQEIFTRYAGVAASSDLFNKNAALVRDLLLRQYGFPLTEADLAWIDRVFKAFYTDGPEIQFWGSSDVDALNPTFRQLMTAKDAMFQTRSFLASEGEFEFVKDLQSKNMIIPVVGDFGGPSAIRRIGDYVRERGDVIHAFYGSNVGIYLNNKQTLAFCRSLATLPRTTNAWFIERDGVRLLSSKLKACPNAKNPE